MWDLRIPYTLFSHEGEGWGCWGQEERNLKVWALHKWKKTFKKKIILGAKRVESKQCIRQFLLNLIKIDKVQTEQRPINYLRKTDSRDIIKLMCYKY